jgi:hypothetical protein
MRNALSKSSGALRMVLLSLMVFSACIFSSPVLLAKSSTKQVQVLKLVQQHYILGSVEVLIASDAVKVLIKDSQSVLLARAPHWKIVEYSPKKRLSHEVELADFRQVGSKMLSIGGFNNQLAWNTLSKVGEDKVEGQLVVKLGRASARVGDRIDDWYISSKTPKEIPMILANFFRLPESPGIPIRFVTEAVVERKSERLPWLARVDQLGKIGSVSTNQFLVTKAITKVQLPEAEFAYPVGYTVSSNESFLLINNDKQELLESIFSSGTDAPEADRKKTPH